ncbi:MAG: hypothetical protein ACR2N7_08855, partial [Acidimicrobiia bacterium]
MTTTQQLKDAATGVGATVQVAGFMIAVALVSVFAVGIYNLVSARDVLQGVSQEQLSDVAASNFESVVLRLDAYGDLAAMLASDRGVVKALGEFDSAYDELPTTSTGEYDADLLAAYEAEFASAPVADDDPDPATLVPESAQAQYLQYWYIAQNPNEDRAMLDGASDGSSYSDVHASHHPAFRAVARGANLGDLVFVNLEGTVVYSVDKNIDVGTSLVGGPHSDSVLAHAAMEVGQDTGAGQSTSTDLEFYAPALYAP